jgi:hypothetical protein
MAQPVSQPPVVNRDASFVPPPAVVAAPAPAPVVPVSKPELPKPVEAAPIADIGPESFGLYSVNEGGLGAAMWKDTSRETIDRLMPYLNLPTMSAALNDLARRFLLTVANIPGARAEKAFSLPTIARITNLVALGNAVEAWKLVNLAKAGQIDEPTLRLAAGNALLTDQAVDVCEKVPAWIKTYADPEWQKILLVCQLTAKDTKAASLTLDVLKNQGAKDDVFFYVAEQLIAGTIKQLPRQLTPLKPLNLALISLTNLPLPTELYGRADGVLAVALLKTKAKDDSARLNLAERMAERGLIRSIDLTTAYAATSFDANVLASAANSAESGTKLRALIYQAAAAEKTPVKHLDLAIKFFQSLSPVAMNGAAVQVAADILSPVVPAAENGAQAGTAARIAMMANRPDMAMSWLKLMNSAAITDGNIGTEHVSLFPLMVFSGLESDSDYAKDFSAWLDLTLKAPPRSDADTVGQLRQTANIVLLLDADGFTVPGDVWSKLLTQPQFEKRAESPVLFLERLAAAGKSVRRGESVLLSLLLSNGDMSLSTRLVVIRTLRLCGLTTEAALVARETVVNSPPLSGKP